MREIKFRVWNKANKRMLFYELTNIGDIISCYPLTTFYEEFEIMQFTGLKDTNGKEIYEGDIVKNKIGDIGTVIFEEAMFCIKTPRGAEWGLFDTSEVLGNIHENPELLITKKESE